MNSNERFISAGPRTFERVEDASGNLVAYIGGNSRAEAQLRALWFVQKLLEEHEKKQETLRKELPTRKEQQP